MGASDLAALITRVRRGHVDQRVVLPIEILTPHQNQALLAIKPECFELSDESLRNYVQMVLDQFDRWGVETIGALVVSGGWWATEGRVERHYGVINRLSTNGSEILTPEQGATVRKAVQVADDARIVGGHELLVEHPELSIEALTRLWRSGEPMRVGSGLYARSVEIPGESFVLINGFHPEQVAHFTDPRQRSALLLIGSDLPWSLMRSHMVGDTTPISARPGSIRRMTAERAGEFGFKMVDSRLNGCHFSAGPFEALAELQNVVRHLLPDADFEKFSLVRALRSLGWEQSIDSLLDNGPIALPGSRGEALYTVTEGVDSLTAASVAMRFAESK